MFWQRVSISTFLQYLEGRQGVQQNGDSSHITVGVSRQFRGRACAVAQFSEQVQVHTRSQDACYLVATHHFQQLLTALNFHRMTTILASPDWGTSGLHL
jgi:hypothetical protein